jgi:hypothetical protein
MEGKLGDEDGWEMAKLMSANDWGWFGLKGNE